MPLLPSQRVRAALASLKSPAKTDAHFFLGDLWKKSPILSSHHACRVPMGPQPCLGIEREGPSLTPPRTSCAPGCPSPRWGKVGPAWDLESPDRKGFGGEGQGQRVWGGRASANPHQASPPQPQQTSIQPSPLTHPSLIILNGQAHKSFY